MVRGSYLTVTERLFGEQGVLHAERFFSPQRKKDIPVEFAECFSVANVQMTALSSVGPIRARMRSVSTCCESLTPAYRQGLVTVWEG